MKNFKLLLIALFSFQTGFSQNWKEMGGGIHGMAFSIVVLNNTAFAGGSIDSASGLLVHNIVMLDLNNPTAHWVDAYGGSTDQVNSLVVIKGKVYACLYSFPSGKGLIRLDGTTWNVVAGGINGGVNSVTCDTVTNTFYAGGGILSIPSVPSPSNWQFLIKWDGVSSNWSYFNSGINSTVVNLAYWNNKIQISGNFNLPFKRIMEWNGTSASGIGSIDSSVYIMECDVANNQLLFGGIFNNPGKKIASYNGTSTSTIGIGIDDTYNSCSVRSIKRGLDNNLYIGGVTPKYKHIVKYDGTNYSAVGTGMSGGGVYSGVYSICAYKDEIFAVGVFDTAGGGSAKNVARIKVSLSGITETNSNYKPLKVYPNPAVCNQPVTIEVGSYKGALNVYDCLGGLVQTEQKKDVSKITLNLPTGMYYLKLDDGSGKLLVQ